MNSCQMPAKLLYHSLPQQDTGRKKSGEKELVGQDKGNSIKKKKERLHSEARENKRFIIYVPLAGDAQPLHGKQGFSTGSGGSRRQT